MSSESKLVSNMTESAVVVKPLGEFEVVIRLEGWII